MLSKISKIIVPATMFAIVAMTMSASSPEAFAKGGRGGGGRGGHGMHGNHRGHRGFGHYRNRGYFGYRNYGWGGYSGYVYPEYSCCSEYAPVCETPVCDSTAVASVYGYPICGSCCDDGGYGFGWGRGYRGHGWGHHRGFRGGRGGHGHGGRGGRR